MPELPEVETIVRSLRLRLLGQEIKSLRLFFPALLRDSRVLALRKFRGRLITGVRRRGKMILLDADSGFSLLFHLKMTGRFFLGPAKAARDRHTRLAILLGNGEELLFQDPRKFGFVRVVETAKAEQALEIKKLGPEPLGLDFPNFYQLFAQRRGRLKSLLLKQSFLAGIGNIYADEICFESRLHPASRVSSMSLYQVQRLWKAIHSVLLRAIEAGGSSIRNFRDGEGRAGSFQSQLRVYGRAGEPCFRCGTKIVRWRLAGRSTHFCPRCQRSIDSVVLPNASPR